MSVTSNQLRQENELLRCSEKDRMSQMEILFYFSPSKYLRQNRGGEKHWTFSKSYSEFRVSYLLKLQ